MHPSTLRRACAVAAAAVATTGLAACGGGSSSSSASSKTPTPTATPSKTASSSGGSGGTDLSIAASETGGLSFSKKTLTAKSGKVTITMDSPNSNHLTHAVAIEGKGVDKDGAVVGPGGKSTVTATLKPGTYTFYCPVDGHRQAGMEGTLTVQ